MGKRDFYKVNENELHHNLQSSKFSCSIAQGSSLVSSQRPAPSFNREHIRAPESKVVMQGLSKIRTYKEEDI